MERKTIRLLIADDHLLFRSGLKQLLQLETNMDLVGEAGNGQELLRRTLELQPDVVLTDIHMPLMDGVAATRELQRRKSNSRVLVLSAFNREEPVLKMLEAGALGYVLKTAATEEIIEGIHTVYRNKPYFCSGITEMLTGIVSKNYQLPPSPDFSFNDREKEIMRLICQEYTSKEIASNLHLSKRTVEGHRTRIMDKIGARSVAGVIRYAMERGVYKT